jgi:hypothetical protein
LREGGRKTYKSIAFRAAGGFIGDDNSFEDLAILLEMLPQGISMRFPGQAAHKDFGIGGVGALLLSHSHFHRGGEEERKESRKGREGKGREGGSREPFTAIYLAQKKDLSMASFLPSSEHPLLPCSPVPVPVHVPVHVHSSHQSVCHAQKQKKKRDKKHIQNKR